MPKHAVFYDVFEFDKSAFEVVSDEEMQSARHHDQCNAGDIGDCGDGVKIASAVTAQTAAELVGLRPPKVAWLERHIAEHGVLGIGNLVENFEVRLSCDD